MLDFKKDVLEARLNIAVSPEMELQLYSIARVYSEEQGKKVSVSLVVREILEDYLQRNFEKIEANLVKSKPKRKYRREEIK